ncbi:MAG: IS200/IS605 family transposase [Chloroflexi bacterium]|nr:IS200/IS605 family transposase [Chloroflexota bacterium]MCC6891514.1 IS200/IS605 family transposase [Anaerolineae bacterium]
MPFWKCFYHAIWSTHKRQPLINEALEKVIFEAIIAKTRSMGGTVHAVNGIADHVHVAVSFPPTVAGTTWLQQVKGLSAHNVNDLFPNLDTHFRWQKGYGLLTFGARNLPKVVGYVNNQKTHHSVNTIIQYLEETDKD